MTKQYKNTVYHLSTDGHIFKKTSLGKMRELKPRPASNGSPEIVLVLNGERKHKTISYLMGETFIPNPEGMKHIIHKDGNIKNNLVENLAWSNGMDGH